MRWVVIRFDIYHPIELEIWNSIDQKQINTIIPAHFERRKNYYSSKEDMGFDLTDFLDMYRVKGE